MNSIQFPNMFNATSTNVVSGYDATLQCLNYLLLSEKGELFGDPYYGTGLKKYLFDQNDVVLQDILLDDIYTAIKLFIPQIKVNRNDITLKITKKGRLSIKINAINRADYSLDTYNLVLFRNKD